MAIWTTDLPSVPGFYWARCSTGPFGHMPPEVARVEVSAPPDPVSSRKEYPSVFVTRTRGESVTATSALGGMRTLFGPRCDPPVEDPRLVKKAGV